MEKKCSKCGIIKPLTDYHKRPSKPIGVRSLCKECCSKIYFDRKNSEEIIYDQALQKECTKCGLTKTLDGFFKQKAGKYGVTSICRDCNNSRNKLNRSKYTGEVKVHEHKCTRCNVIKSSSEFHKTKSSNKGISVICKTCKSIIAHNTRKENRDKLTAEYRERYKQDPIFRITQQIRNRTRTAINRGYKKTKALTLLGCTIDELKIYLQAKFAPTMTWENYGTIWHIDHIIPCSSFDLTDPEQQRKCFHYTNLQPLFAVTTEIDGVTYIGNLNKNAKLFI